MAFLNKVFLIGNLTRDPEIRCTPGGMSICAIGMATNRKYTTSKGEEKDETCFVDINVWGKQAESCSKYLKKGAPVFIEGRLKFEQWNDRETDRKRNRLSVTAERVQFLSQSGRGSDYGNSPPEYSSSESTEKSGYSNQGSPSPDHEPPPFPTDNEGNNKSNLISENSEKVQNDAIDDIPF